MEHRFRRISKVLVVVVCKYVLAFGDQPGHEVFERNLRFFGLLPESYWLGPYGHRVGHTILVATYTSAK